MKRDRPCGPGSRRSCRHADRDPAPAGPSAPGCSCRSACPSPRPRSRPSPQPETRSCPVQNLHQTSQHHRIDDGVDREPAPVGQRDLDAVFAVGGWLCNRLAACRAGGIRSNLHRKKLWATARDKLARPEIPTPPCQQGPRNLVSPGRRGTLPKAPKVSIGAHGCRPRSPQLSKRISRARSTICSHGITTSPCDRDTAYNLWRGYLRLQVLTACLSFAARGRRGSSCTAGISHP